MSQVTVYGADWCGMTRRTLAHLDQLGVTYEYINVEKNPQASEWVKRQNNGKEKKPTVDIGGVILSAPGNRQLEETLRNERILT